jgi:hypothetical protein
MVQRLQNEFVDPASGFLKAYYASSTPSQRVSKISTSKASKESKAE